MPRMNASQNSRHSKLHDTKSSEKPYVIQTLFRKCDQCDSQFSDKRNLNKHKLKVHGIGRWISCDLCDYKSANKHAIYKHEQFVHKRLRFSCDACDFQYTQANKLKSISRQNTKVLNLFAPSVNTKKIPNPDLAIMFLQGIEVKDISVICVRWNSLRKVILKFISRQSMNLLCNSTAKNVTKRRTEKIIYRVTKMQSITELFSNASCVITRQR